MEGIMVLYHFPKRPADRPWVDNAKARYPRPLLFILPAALLSWAFIVVIGMGVVRLLGV